MDRTQAPFLKLVEEDPTILVTGVFYLGGGADTARSFGERCYYAASEFLGAVAPTASMDLRLVYLVKTLSGVPDAPMHGNHQFKYGGSHD